MSTFNSLEIGKRALLANRLGLDVTSNNIANVNTPGYSRRQVEMTESTPLLTQSGFVGTGVLVDKLRTFREEFFDKEIRKNSSRQAGYQADETIFQKIEAVLVEPSENGLNEIVGEFFNAFQELSLNPSNVANRQLVLDLATTMTDRFHTTAAQFQQLREDTLLQSQTRVEKANNLLGEIGDLNQKISTAYSTNDGSVQTLVDQREQYLEDLANITGVSVTQGESGTVNVFINGINLITNNTVSKLQLNETTNSGTGERTLQLIKTEADGSGKSLLSPQSGELASLLKHYNITLDDKDSSGGFSVLKGLNDFAAAIAANVNAITIRGYGLDDTGTIPPGRNFFEPSIGKATAETLEVSDVVKDKPRDLPVADASGESGNNTIAMEIANLASNSNFINGCTPTEYYSLYLSKIGQLTKDAANGYTTTQLVTEQLSNQRESVIGVNLDEEAVNLIKFQKAFEAAARVVNTTNEILATIISLGA